MLSKRIFVVMFLLVFLLLVGCAPSAPPIDENQAPVIVSVPTTNAKVGVGYIYNVGATDPDEDSLTYGLVINPTNMSINQFTGVITWTPTSSGSFGVIVKVSDGALSVTQSFNILVEAVTDPCVPPCPEPDPCDPPCPPTPQEVKLISIVVVPKTMTLFVGETEDIVSVTAHYNDGSSFVLDQPGYDYGNGSDDNSVATVTVAHLVEAVSVGEATITVSYTEEGVTKIDIIEVTVNPILLTSIEVLPETMLFLIADHHKPITSVTAHYNDGSTAIIAPGDCTYLSSDMWVAVVLSTGTVFKTGLGTATIIVMYEDKTDTVEVTVGPVHNVTQDFYRDTIQDAIDDVETLAGDTIKVSEGTYPENVVIPYTKAGLQLIGAGSDVTSIAPVSGKAVALDGNHGFMDGIRVQGFTLETADANYAFIALSGTPDGTYYTTNLVLEDIVVDGGIYGIGLNAVNGVTFTDVHVSNVSIGGQGGIEMTGVFDFTFTDGSLEGNYRGIRLQISPSYGINGNIHIHDSILTGNVIAIENQDASTIIDATNNWWGDLSGPYNLATNPDGLGNAVSDYVNYGSWNTSP